MREFEEKIAKLEPAKLEAWWSACGKQLDALIGQ